MKPDPTNPEPGHDCESLRFALLRRAEGPDASSADGADRRDPAEDAASRALDLHLARCGDCRRELARAKARTDLVQSLDRRAAPAELDGAVVAALQAGVRQERVIEAVALLTPIAAPSDLARRIAVPRAPAVLDRLVGEELADPAKAVASRYARRLERLRAPDDLERRVGPVRAGPRRPRALPVALALAGLCLMIGALGLAHLLRDAVEVRPTVVAGPVLVVEHVGSIRDLDPAATQILSGLSGGLVDAVRLKQEEL